MNQPIRYINGTDISLPQWKECLRLGGRGTLYAEPAFMKAMAGGWAAFVLGNYEAVLPVFPRKKWGIQYLYQPAFIQQSAIHASGILSPQVVTALLTKVQATFKFGEIYLSPAEGICATASKKNFLLSLQPSYSVLEASYKPDLRKNRKIASRQAFRYQNGAIDRVIGHFQQTYQNRLNYTAQDYQALGRYCQQVKEKDRVIVREVWLGEMLEAACLCIADQERIYLLLNYTAADARKRAANHYLLDQLIREYAGSGKLLDLEGSDHPGIAHFYQNFGAVNEPYYFLGWNRLPWPLRLLKPGY